MDVFWLVDSPALLWVPKKKKPKKLFVTLQRGFPSRRAARCQVTKTPPDWFCRVWTARGSKALLRSSLNGNGPYSLTPHQLCPIRGEPDGWTGSSLGAAGLKCCREENGEQASFSFLCLIRSKQLSQPNLKLPYSAKFTLPTLANDNMCL